MFVCLGGESWAPSFWEAPAPNNLYISKRPQTGNLYLDHIPRRRKELKLGKADADGYSPAEVRRQQLCLAEREGKWQSPPSSAQQATAAPGSGGEHPEALTVQLHIFIHPELPLSTVRRSPSLQLSFFNGSINSDTIKPGEV